MSTPIGTYESGSCAEVWSVTISIATPIESSNGKSSAVFPTNPTESGVPEFLAFNTRSTASVKLSAISSK